ncbi:MAG: hypothetical protein ACR2MS_05620 [Weeksellaceae bacterium]
MPYQEVFSQFWSQVQQSVEAGNFAKLTMAKTIGKPDLRNIFVRPTASDDVHKFLLKLRYRSRDVKDIEKELTLDEVLVEIKSHLKNPFWSVLLFTTEKDVIFKINKKDAGTIVEQDPTFTEVVLAEKDMD